MPTSKSSKAWLREHFSDPYVKQAQKEGYRSRAVYKLLEIQEKYRIFKPGMTVIDLGAAPGGWSQLAIKFVGSKGKVIASDILAMEAVPGVQFIQGDFSTEEVEKKIEALLGSQKADWVLSDIAPNMSGNDSVDIPRAMYLAELVIDFAQNNLKVDGGIFIKLFQGEGFDELLKRIKKDYKSVLIRKPKASRGRSREIYVLARVRK